MTLILGSSVEGDMSLTTPGMPAVLVSTSSQPRAMKFTGTARPSPSFLYDGGRILEGLIVVEDEPSVLHYRHSLALLDVAHFVSELAVENNSPILSMHSPCQAPPHSKDRADIYKREDAWSRTSSFSLRFAVLLRDGSASRRFDFVDRVAYFCEGRGFGFWTNDTRDGVRAGNWFSLVKHERGAARRSLSRVADKPGHSEVHCVLPITIVGPARVGSTNAILAALEQLKHVGLASVSITSLDDLAFVHVQLPLLYSSPREAGALSRELEAIIRSSSRPSPLTPLDFLESTAPLLLGDRAISSSLSYKVRTLVQERAGDYQTLAGPVLTVASVRESRRSPLWVAWQLRTPGAKLEDVTSALRMSIEDLGLNEAGAGPVNVEYAICRARSESQLRGRAKLSIPTDNLPEWTRSSEVETPAATLCRELETRWRAKLAEAGVQALVSVGDRESRVGRWDVAT